MQSVTFKWSSRGRPVSDRKTPNLRSRSHSIAIGHKEAALSAGILAVNVSVISGAPLSRSLQVVRDWKGGLLVKKSFQQCGFPDSILENLEILDSRDKDSYSQKTSFIMTPSSMPQNSGIKLQNQELHTQLKDRLAHHPHKNHVEHCNCNPGCGVSSAALTPIKGVYIRANGPPDATGYLVRKLPLWAAFSFQNYYRCQGQLAGQPARGGLRAKLIPSGLVPLSMSWLLCDEHDLLGNGSVALRHALALHSLSLSKHRGYANVRDAFFYLRSSPKLLRNEFQKHSFIHKRARGMSLSRNYFFTRKLHPKTSIYVCHIFWLECTSKHLFNESSSLSTCVYIYLYTYIYICCRVNNLATFWPFQGQ